RTCVQAGGLRDVIIRLMVSRGPGGFTVNPYECPRSQLYVFIYKLKTPTPQAYEEGVTIVSVPVPVKPAFFANIKSCAYLHNALTKKTAIEAGADYGVNWDENGFLAEGATENVILVSPEGELLHPGFERVLRGVTLARVLALAENLTAEGLIKAVRTARIDRDLASRAREVMLAGTSLDVLPVTAWDGRRVGQGRPGPVARRLLAAIRDDIAHNQDFLTPMFD
ncbi:MAG: aminotransferase class IV, partial [Pseudomonadota bacterium]